jgi:DNA-binding transcriptional LysR family regulator
MCCLSTAISASSATRDRNRSLAIARINRHKSSIGNQHRAILSQLPARSNLRQGQQGGYGLTLRIADLESSSLIARKIVAIDRVICTSPSYLAQHDMPKHPNDLRSHALLTYGFLLTGNQWKLTGKDGEHWIQPEWTLCANNAEVLRDAAVKGRGMALIPTFIASDALENSALQPLLQDYHAPPLALYAIYPRTPAGGGGGKRDLHHGG